MRENRVFSETSIRQTVLLMCFGRKKMPSKPVKFHYIHYSHYISTVNSHWTEVKNHILPLKKHRFRLITSQLSPVHVSLPLTV